MPGARRRHCDWPSNRTTTPACCPGCSNWPAWKVATAVGVSERRGFARFETVQAYYSLAGRDLEREMIPLLDHAKGGLLVWSPLAGGLLSGRFDRNNQSPEGSRRSGFDFPVVDKEGSG